MLSNLSSGPRFLAAGCGDGSIRVFNIMTGRLSYNLQGGSNTAMPTTSIRYASLAYTWRPFGPGPSSRRPNTTGSLPDPLRLCPCSWPLRWRPAGTADFNKTRNVLIASNAAGVVQHWHVTSGKLLHTTRSADKNQIFCVDYKADGSSFATAGERALL